MLIAELEKGTLYSPELKIHFSEGPYRYGLSGVKDEKSFSISGVSGYDSDEQKEGERLLIGRFQSIDIEMRHAMRTRGDRIEETITLINHSPSAVSINKVDFGFTSNLQNRPDWYLTAIPFKVQLDGNRHEYSGEILANGTFKNLIGYIKAEKRETGEKTYGNSVWADPTRPEPELMEDGILRSEAWAWGTKDQGIVIIKYNNDDIELSVAEPVKDQDATCLRFGGAGFCLYGEPSGARVLEPGIPYSFGTTIYHLFTGGVSNAFYLYRSFLESKGHTHAQTYNPPVNWNELYDIGWYHSDKEQLKKYYTREALLEEAALARECGCDLLYLDPGWEVAEGLTLWDEQRLGPVRELVRILQDEYGLGLGYRTILRTYVDDWPKEVLVRHDMEKEPMSCVLNETQLIWEVCLNNSAFAKEKLKRIMDISGQGVQFMMFDEMDWRGPCYDPAHGHKVSVMPIDHVMAVYKLANEVRKQCPGLLTEVHDPVWPWLRSRYLPTYFKQGAIGTGYYDENWGFEFMWHCLDDLKSGKALSLYYYNLGCSIPLYLHITMAADNDQCIFFWWAASTVRHLGIGGKNSNPTIEPGNGLPPYDKEKRFGAYKECMRRYNALKAYFVCGVFTGVAENIHLHTLPDKKGAVINVFNVSEDTAEIDFFVGHDSLGEMDRIVQGADEWNWTSEGLDAKVILEPMSHRLVTVGEAAESNKI